MESAFSAMHRSAGIVASVGLHTGISHIDPIYDIPAEYQYCGAKCLRTVSRHEFHFAAVSCLVTALNQARSGHHLHSGLGPAFFLASDSAED